MDLLSQIHPHSQTRTRALIWSFSCHPHSWRRHNGSLFHRFGPFCRQERRSCFGYFPNGRCAVIRTHACTRAQTRAREVKQGKKRPPPRAKTLSPETQRCKDCFGFNAALFSQLEVSRRRVRFSARSHILWIPQSPLPKTKATFQKDWGRRGREKHACSEDEPLTVGTRTRAEPT